MSIRTTRNDTNERERYHPYPVKRATYGLTPVNRNTDGYVPKGTKPDYMLMNFGNMNTKMAREEIIPDKISFKKTVPNDRFLRIYLFTPYINGVNKFTVMPINHKEFERDYKNNKFELYRYKNKQHSNYYIYIFEKPDSDSQAGELMKLKQTIRKELNINFMDGRVLRAPPDPLSRFGETLNSRDDLFKLGGAAKSKKYVLYNNKRRLVKINAENKKYIVCDRTDILLSTIKGKFRYMLD
jgi:hypothetical protein